MKRVPWNIIPKINWALFIKLNFFCKQINRTPRAYIIPYRGTNIVLSKYAHVELKANLTINFFETRNGRTGTSIILEENSLLKITGRHRLFFGADIKVFAEGTLIIGKGYCNSGAQIRCAKRIIIKDGLAAARDMIIIDSDAHEIYDSMHEMKKDVCIEENVWIGTRAMVLKGVTIGKGSIVAAGAVVTKNIPAHSMVAGIPAKVIKSNIVFKV